MSYRVIRKGFDTLEVAFKGALSGEVLRQLREAKALATSERHEVALEIGGVRGHVSETGARGGYQFVFNTGDHGEIWTIRDNTDPEEWNLRAKVRPLNLVVNGLHGVQEILFERLAAWGGKIVEESVGRVDYAVDFVAPHFVIRPEDFTFHSSSRCSEYREIPEGGSGFAVHRKASRPTGILIGKMPNREVTIYDKRLQQIRKVGSPWFEIWGMDKNDCPPVWRVEVRAGKDHLKGWGITTFEQLDERIGDVFAAAFQSVRLLVWRESNVTRSEVHPLWKLARDEVMGAVEDKISDGVKRRVLSVSEDELREMYRKQLFGLAIGYAVLQGMTPQRAVKEFGNMLAEAWGMFTQSEPGRFVKKYKKAMDRLAFLKEADPLCRTGSETPKRLE